MRCLCIAGIPACGDKVVSSCKERDTGRQARMPVLRVASIPVCAQSFSPGTDLLPTAYSPRSRRNRRSPLRSRAVAWRARSGVRGAPEIRAPQGGDAGGNMTNSKPEIGTHKYDEPTNTLHRPVGAEKIPFFKPFITFMVKKAVRRCR